MGRFSLIFIALSFTVCFNNAFSQTYSCKQRRIINENVLLIIDNYEKYSEFTLNRKNIDPNYIQNFKTLFNDNALVYNDILPANRLNENIPVEEYINVFQDYYSAGIGVKISNILIGTPQPKSGENHEVNVSIYKEQYGYTNRDANYKDTIELNLNISFQIINKVPLNFKIYKISNNAEKGRFLKFQFVKNWGKKPLENFSVLFDKNEFITNEKGQIYIEDIDPDDYHYLKTSDENYSNLNELILVDEYLKSNSDRNHTKCKYNYYDPNEFIYLLHSKNFILSPFFSVNVPGFKTIKGINSSNITDSNVVVADVENKWLLNSRIGLRAGIVLLRRSKFNLLVFTGVERSYLKSKITFDSYHKELSGSFDPDEDGYTRLIDITKFEQITKLHYTDYPFLLTINYKTAKCFNVFASAGIRYSIRTNSMYNITANGYIRGLYPQYQNLVIYDYYDFGNRNLTEHGVFKNKSRLLSYQFTYAISKKINNVNIYAGPTLLFYGEPVKQTSSSYDVIDDFSDNLYDITNAFEKIKLQAITLEFGLIYNFAISLK